MLKIIKNAQDLDQKDEIEQWMSEHEEYHFPDWDFSELSEWVDKMENPEGKQRIKAYLDIFLKQKYTRLKENQIVYNTTTPNSGTKNNPYPNSQTQNTDEKSPEANEEEEEEEPFIYEPDPYLNNLYETENVYSNSGDIVEIQSYPNPYEELSKDPNDGVSHTYNEEVTPY